MADTARRLDDLCGPSPCPLSWDQLASNDRSRHCAVCGQQVLNLSALTRQQAERALADSRVGCVRLLRDAEGAAIHAPARPWWASLTRLAAMLGTAVSLLFGTGCAKSPTDAECTPAAGLHGEPPQATASQPARLRHSQTQWMGK